MSKTDHHLLRQKVNQRISVIPENCHFNSRFVSKTTKAPVFVFITEILWRTFWHYKWQSVFDVVKDSSFRVLLRICFIFLVSPMWEIQKKFKLKFNPRKYDLNPFDIIGMIFGGLFWTPLPTLKSDVIYECSLMQAFKVGA